jgi:hypothetical protein
VAVLAVLAFAAGMRSGRPEPDLSGEARAATARPTGGPVRIAWGGDTTLGSSFGLPPGRGWPALRPVASVLRAADLAAVNLEGTFAPGGGSKCTSATDADAEAESGAVSTCYAFQAPPENARTLKRAGVDVVNTANNHAFDFGPLGWRGTRDALAAAKVKATGAPGEIRVMERNGTRIALLGFSTYPWSSGMSDDANVRALVAAAARKAPVVVAFFHAGAEGNDQTHVPAAAEEAFGEDRGDSRRFAHVAIDAGADLVLGSGPHVLRGVEVYRDRLIAYSLGNLAGWDNFATGGPSSLSALIRVRLAPDGRAIRGRIASLVLDGHGAPRPDDTDAAAAQMRSLSAEDFGAASAWRRGVLGAG